MENVNSVVKRCLSDVDQKVSQSSLFILWNGLGAWESDSFQKESKDVGSGQEYNFFREI